MSTFLSASISSRYSSTPKAVNFAVTPAQATEKSPTEKVAVAIGKLVPAEALLFLGAAAATIKTVPADTWGTVVGVLSLGASVVLVVALTFVAYRSDAKKNLVPVDYGKVTVDSLVALAALVVWLIFTDKSVLQTTVGWVAPQSTWLSLVALVASPILLLAVALKSK